MRITIFIHWNELIHQIHINYIIRSYYHNFNHLNKQYRNAPGNLLQVNNLIINNSVWNTWLLLHIILRYILDRYRCSLLVILRCPGWVLLHLVLLLRCPGRVFHLHMLLKKSFLKIESKKTRKKVVIRSKDLKVTKNLKVV